jgi:2-polyprenyl-3-methyl-5-hydroxy-6-metoxy-1,4-benzoquinol methylase
MEISVYYAYQAKARGLNSVKDVLKIVEDNTRLYDELVLPWLPGKKDATIVEVACGPGIFLHWLKSKGYSNALGSDSSDAQIILANEGGLSVMLTDAITHLSSIESNSIDCLIGLDFYGHLPKEVFLDFIFEAYRVIRPGGNLILRGPNGNSPVVGCSLYNDITHITALTEVAFKALLAMVGFSKFKFEDETLASIQKQRWLRVPIAWIFQNILRCVIRCATREYVAQLSSSMFICAWK